jgi:hypothetical protein
MRNSSSKSVNRAVWTIQGLLAALFLFGGVMNLVMPIEAMTQDIALPGWFLRVIGVAEVAGALGLLLPGMLGIRQGLTPLAAAGLIVIMCGAVVLTAVTGGVGAAAVPFVVGVLLAVIVRVRRSALVGAGFSRPTWAA